MTYTYGNPDAKTVLIQMIDDHDLKGIEEEAEKIHDLTNMDFYLICIRVHSWNDDLSPNHFKDAGIRTARGFAWLLETWYEWPL